MLVQREQRLDPAQARALIDAHPWATLVTGGGEGLMASHMPALAQTTATGELVILTHTARADPMAERIERGAEVLIVFEGENGFLPGEWSGGPEPSTGTWNFEAVHVRGRPEPLDRAGSLELLRRTFEHLEARRERPSPWSAVAPVAERIVGGTCCFRVPARSLAAKAKLGQGKPREERERLIARLEAPGPYAQPALARRMREALGPEQP
jgi:transcriptional regulator